MTTAREFRDFFAAIPDEKWSTDVYWTDGVQCCAYGHLGVRLVDGVTPEFSGDAFEFRRLGAQHGIMWACVNDRWHADRQEPTPKARILAALDEIITEETK